MDYKKYKVDQLRELCRNMNLESSGNKSDLLERLKSHEVGRSKELDFDGAKLATEQLSRVSPLYKSLFIRMKSANLPRYLNAGIIYPLALEDNLIYKAENRKKDYFTFREDYIITADRKFGPFENDDIYVEIFSSNLNYETFNCDPFLLLPSPIAISRIKKVYFKSAELRKSFLSSINTFPDFFFPEALCDVSQTPDSFELDILKLSEVPENKNLLLWKQKLDKFDRVMGMFAYMKNTGVIFAEELNQYQEYTPTFFSAASMLNVSLSVTPSSRDSSLFKSMLYPNDLDTSNSQRFLFKQILDAIYANVDFTFEIGQKLIMELVASKIASEGENNELRIVLTFFDRLKSHQTTFIEIFKVDFVRKNYPLLALLFLVRFSNKSRQHTDKQAARNLFIQNDLHLSKPISEFLLAILGLYYGYKTLIKKDTNLVFSDPNFENLANREQSIKFKLQSKLELLLIESIFNWTSTNQQIDELFKFIHGEDPKGLKPIALINSSGFQYVDKSVSFVDTKITILERVSLFQQLLDSLEKNYPRKVSSDSHLLHYLIQKFGIDKIFLCDLVKTNRDKIDVAKLSKLIEFDLSK